VERREEGVKVVEPLRYLWGRGIIQRIIETREGKGGVLGKKEPAETGRYWGLGAMVEKEKGSGREDMLLLSTNFHHLEREGDRGGG